MSRLTSYTVKGLLAVAVVAGGLMGHRMLVESRPQLQSEVAPERIWPVAAVRARSGPVTPELQLYGEVVAGRAVELRALVAGEVVAVGEGLVEGGIVKAGDPLVTIDPFDYRAALDEARAQRAEADARRRELRAQVASASGALTRDREMLTLLKRDLKRVERLFEKKNVSDKRLDEARMEITRQRQTIVMRDNDVVAGKARLAQQVAAIERLDVAVRRAERNLKQTELRAPFDGYVTEVAAERGKRLSANDRVATLYDSGRLEARVQVSDAQYGRLAAAEAGVIGRPVTVIWRVGRNDLVYRGRVARVAAGIDAASGGVDLYARIEDNDLDGPLRPGAFVRLQLADAPFDDVIRLPDAAVHDGDHVFVVGGEDRLETRRVGLIGRVGGDVLVRGELTDGDRVVVTRFTEIGPGQRVRVVE